jgi:hypothetical protein
MVSAEVLQWEGEEGNLGTFQPFIITGLQLCLWVTAIMQRSCMTLTHTKLNLGGRPFPIVLPVAAALVIFVTTPS